MVGQSLSKNCIKPRQKISKNIKHWYELALSCGFLDDCRVWFCPGLQQGLIDLTRESDTGYSSNARLGSKKDQQVFFPKNHQRSSGQHPPNFPVGPVRFPSNWFGCTLVNPKIDVKLMFIPPNLRYIYIYTIYIYTLDILYYIYIYYKYIFYMVQSWTHDVIPAGPTSANRMWLSPRDDPHPPRGRRPKIAMQFHVLAQRPPGATSLEMPLKTLVSCIGYGYKWEITISHQHHVTICMYIYIL